MSFDRLLRWALFAGAIIDIAFGGSVLVAGGPVLRLMDIVPPADLVYAQLAALLSISVGLSFFVAAREPLRHRPIINVAALTRFGAAALLAWFVGRGSMPRQIYFLAAGELVLGILHGVYSRRLGGMKETYTS